MEFEDEMVVDTNLDLEEGEIDEPSEPSEPSVDDRKLLRAKRFGTISTAPTSSDPEVAAFHARMGVDSNTRTEALHLLGTEAMKTDDVFAYFQGETPASIEWISGNSCNIFWLDDVVCAKSFIANSIAIKGLPGMIKDTDENPNEEFINFKDVRVALPPGNWRKGKTFSLAPNLYIRFARFTDKKSFQKFNPEFQTRNKVFLDEGDETGKKVRAESGNPWVDIATQWSYHEHKSCVKKSMFEPIPILPIRDARELISNRKTNLKRKRESQSEHSESEESVEEIPIGKMHADLEQERMERRLNRNPKTIDLRDKLGRRRRRNDRARSPLRIDEEIRLSLRMAQDKRKKERSRDILLSESEGEHSEEDLRKKLRRPSSLCKRKLKRQQKEIIRSPLRIEIDNDIYFDESRD